MGQGAGRGTGADTARPLDVRLDADGLHLGERLAVRLVRTLRVPDDPDEALPVPPGIGTFPARPVDRVASDATMLQRGGIVVPMLQREALRLTFSAVEPIAVQVSAGLVCAVSGEDLTRGLAGRPQNYLVAPDQPWIDGFKVAHGVVRQFVAALLGLGATVEEQLVTQAAVGGVQLRAFRLTAAVRDDLRQERRLEERLREERLLRSRYAPASPGPDRSADAMPAPPPQDAESPMTFDGSERGAAPRARGIVGLGMGGAIRQVIARDGFGVDAWEPEPFASVWVHLADARTWPELTGEALPSTPIDAGAYAHHGLPWFELYDADREDVAAAARLRRVRGVTDVLGLERLRGALPTWIVPVARGDDWRGADRVVVPSGHWSEWTSEPVRIEPPVTDDERP